MRRVVVLVPTPELREWIVDRVSSIRTPSSGLTLRRRDGRTEGGWYCILGQFFSSLYGHLLWSTFLFVCVHPTDTKPSLFFFFVNALLLRASTASLYPFRVTRAEETGGYGEKEINLSKYQPLRKNQLRQCITAVCSTLRRPLFEFRRGA